MLYSLAVKYVDCLYYETNSSGSESSELNFLCVCPFLIINNNMFLLSLHEEKKLVYFYVKRWNLMIFRVKQAFFKTFVMKFDVLHKRKSKFGPKWKRFEKFVLKLEDIRPERVELEFKGIWSDKTLKITQSWVWLTKAYKNPEKRRGNNFLDDLNW